MKGSVRGVQSDPSEASPESRIAAQGVPLGADREIHERGIAFVDRLVKVLEGLIERAGLGAEHGPLQGGQVMTARVLETVAHDGQPPARRVRVLQRLQSVGADAERFRVPRFRFGEVLSICDAALDEDGRT